INFPSAKSSNGKCVNSTNLFSSGWTSGIYQKMNLRFFMDLFFGKPPPVKVNMARSDDLHEASATRGCLIIGDPGSGKTRYAAMQIFKRWKKNPHPVFVLDWSGGMTN